MKGQAAEVLSYGAFAHLHPRSQKIPGTQSALISANFMASFERIRRRPREANNAWRDEQRRRFKQGGKVLFQSIEYPTPGNPGKFVIEQEYAEEHEQGHG